ncbi:MAG: GldG family protein, partial [bacterium]|nr:GldG family protein [bacterium]
LDLERQVQVEAFISPVVPETYVEARLNLLAMLQELQARGGGDVQVVIHDTERFSEESADAERRFGIQPRRVVTMRRGALSEDYIFMGVAFKCGLETVALPFLDRGIPAEYELVRSICTVTQQQRKKIGILQTDAQLYGQFNMQSMSSSPNWPIIDELEKMYEVVRVDPSSPIAERFDALLAVQPSSLGEQEMTNFVAAVRAGQPTAIFEDPFPGFAGNVPATAAPRRPPGGMNPMMMRQQPPPPKGNINELWGLLGVDFAADLITWQDYNPYPRLRHLPPELVFVDD